MKKKIDWNRLWKLPEDLKNKIVKGKTPHSKESGEISEWIGIALNRLETHDEMRAIAKQIHSSTTYKEFNSSITAYLKANSDTKKQVCDGKIHILDLIKKNPKRLSEEDKKNFDRYNKARELRDHMKMFYQDLKFFLEGTNEDRDYLKDFLKPERIHYLASVLSCIRKEELLKTLLKSEGIKSWEDL